MKKILLCIAVFISVLVTAQKKSVFTGDFNKISKLKLDKKKAHASYYNNKFNGRKMADGSKFDNDKLTAAHRKFPFGTKLKITNEKNQKFVIVEVTDRGPFTKGREIDLSKKAFMDIASNKSSGVIDVKIEVVEN